MQNNLSRLANFPVSFFSSVMGMAGFSIAITRAEAIYHLQPGVALSLSYVTLVLFVSLLVIYLFKMIKEKEAVIKEFHHPVKISFFPTISISLLLLSICMLHNEVTLAYLLWVLGTMMHLGFTL